MGLRQTKKISELESLSSATLDTTYVVGISGSNTYKISINKLTSSLDTTFATDLVTTALSGTLDGKLSTSSFQSYTASISTASLVTSINNLNTFTASQSTSSLVNRLTAIENVSGSWITENETGSFLTSLNGAISSSSQLTSSYDSRYVLSGSITQTTWDNISGKPSGLVSQSTDLSSLNSFTASNANTSLNEATSSYETKGNGIVSGSSQLTSSFDTRYTLSGSVQPLPSNLVSSSAQITAFGFVSGSYETTGRGILSSSANLVTTSSFNEYTASISTASLVTSITQLNTYTASVSTASLVISINNLNSATSSYLTSLSGAISSSSQLTASFDVRYALSGSGGGSTTIPDGTVSGSSQLTASFDNRYLNTGGDGVISGSSQLTSSFETVGSGIYSSSAQLPSGLISGSSQLPNGLVSGSSQLTASYDTRYALSGSGGSTTIPAGTISGSSQLTASFDLRYLVTGSVTSSINALNTFSASENTKASTLATYTSSLNVWTSSVATTGSNQFNGNQFITGSLTITTGSFVASQLLANTSSLYLTSGSNMYVQNNGVVEISGSLLVSGSTTLTGSMSISSGSITMPNRPAFRVTGAGGGKAAVTTLSGSYLNVDYQQGSGWDNSTGTFTAPIAGLYQVNVVVRTNSNSGASSQLIVYKNNTGGTTGTPQIMIEFAANTTMNHTGGSTISKLAVGDTLKMVVALGEISFDSNDNFSVAYIG